MEDRQIIELFGQIPHFADEVIISLEHTDIHRNQLFKSVHYEAYEASVNPLEAIGTIHPDYVGLTWREFLSKGKRMPHNLQRFRENPQYYTDVIIRVPSMHYLKCDGKLYITEDGNHRTCIGKFYGYNHQNPYIHGVHLIEEGYDHSFRSKVDELKKILPKGYNISIQRHRVRREDGAGWYKDFFDLQMQVEDTKGVVFSVTNLEMDGRGIMEIALEINKKKKWFHFF